MHKANTSTHDIVLSDGRRSVGLIICDSNGNHAPTTISRKPIERMALKTSNSTQKWGNFDYPWMPIAQEDFSLGSGALIQDDNTQKYYYGERINTNSVGKVYLAPAVRYTRGLRNASNNMGDITYWEKTIGVYTSLVFTVNAEFTMSHIYINIKRHGNPESLKIELREGSAVLATDEAGITSAQDRMSVLHRFNITHTLEVGKTYRIVLYSYNNTIKDCWMLGMNNVVGDTYTSKNGITWTRHSYGLKCRITDADNNNRPILVNYKQSVYCIMNKGHGVAPSMYILGDRGVAVSNAGALDKLKDTSKSWIENEWAGCVVKIIGGKGLEEKQPYRVILTNTDKELTVSPAWEIAHDNTTTYVITGSDKWRAVTGHGLTTNVTDVEEINGILYICQGGEVVTRRMRWYNNAGTATYEFADEGTLKAVYMVLVRLTEVWAATRRVLSVAAAVTSWTDMTFTQVANFTDSKGAITGLVDYDNKCFVFREGTFYAASALYNPPVIDEVGLEELQTMKSRITALARTAQNQYLFFSYGHIINRYYNANLDEVSYNKGDGLPDEHKGHCSKLIAYPGAVIAAIDGNENNYSSIMMYNNQGWSNIYKSAQKGVNITEMLIENIEWDSRFVPYYGGSISNISPVDEKTTRLYFNIGNDIAYLIMPSYTTNPLHDKKYRYYHEGHIVTGYMYSSLMDAYKIYQSLKIFAENLDTNTYIEVDYQTDDETEWKMIEGIYDKTPMKELPLSGEGVTGKRIRFRIRFYTNDSRKTPIVRAVVLESIVIATVKYSYSFNYRNYNNDVNLLGEIEDIDIQERQELIDYWAEHAIPLTMMSNKTKYDNKKVFISPTSTTNVKTKDEGYIENIVLIER